MYERVLVTGAAGMLGSALVPMLKDIGLEVLATDIVGDGEFLDVRDAVAVRSTVKDCAPHLVVHLAAETDLEFCEKSRDRALATNVLGVLNVSLAAEAVGAKLVYVSTAGVFDGMQHAYGVFDHPNPINWYGVTKLRGEYAALAASSDPLIVRTGWMFGGGPGKDKKFVGMMLSQIAEGSTRLRVVDDKYGSPTYTADLVQAIWRLCFNNAGRVWHAAGDGNGPSRYEVAMEIVSILGRRDIEVVPVSSQEFAREYPVNRPVYEVMMNSVIPGRQELMRPWHVALREYIGAYWAHLIQPIAA